MRWFKWFKRIFTASLFFAFLGALGIGGLYLYVAPELPSVDALKDVKLQTPMKVYSADAKLIAQFGEQRRIPLEIDEIPPRLIEAFLATEDTRFYSHSGIDPIGIVRAFVNLILTGEKQQGASTITMQVARNFFLSREKTYIRKIKEIFLAIRIEQELSKDEILALYLNKIPLGYRAFGVGAAAEVYYGKSVSELTLAQMAVIAGLPKAPSRLNPIYSPERAQARRSVVLRRMLDVGYIDQAAFAEADAAPITGRYHGPLVELYAPYVAEMARRHIVELVGEEQAYTGGYHIYTTIDSSLQSAALTAIKQNLYRYDQRHGYRGPVATLWDAADSAVQPWSFEAIVEYLDDKAPVADLEAAVVTELGEHSAEVILRGGMQATLDWDGVKWARQYIDDERQAAAPDAIGEVLSPGQQIWVMRGQDEQLVLGQVPEANSAFVALNPADGAILALSGGFNFNQSQYNRATQAKRQVGSNIKPFIYSAALEHGLTLASLINDAPINQWDRSQGIAWRPQNSPAVYEGPIRLRMALGKSKNVVSVRLLRQIGIDNARRYLTRFGLPLNDLPRNESLSLGSASVTPMEVVRGFAVFANGGFLVTPYIVNRIEDDFGNYIFQERPMVACQACTEADNAELDIAQAPAPDTAFKPCPAQPVDLSQQAPRVITAQNAFLVREMLRSAIWGGGSWRHQTGWNGTGWRAARALKRQDIGGKTGTTNEARDTWFSGFGPNIVATSWVGFDNPSRTLGSSSHNPNLGKDQISGREFGAKTALPAWIDFMKVALDDKPVNTDEVPQGIVTVRIDRESGKLARQPGPRSRFEYFIDGTQPTLYEEPSRQGSVFDTPETTNKDEELF